MSVILEGPDGGGKTTLAGQLKAAIPELREMSRFCTSTGGAIDNLWQETEARLHQLAIPYAIFDRHPLWSEYVYQQALGRQMIDAFYDGSASVAHSLLEEHAMVIVCLPGIEVVRERLRAEEQLAGVEYAIDDIYERYLTRVSQFTGTAFVYEGGPDQFEALCAFVRAHITIRTKANEEAISE
ncbi:thymidylate kinase [Gordonia phage GiKK]|nr:thymidylate kinase [Gordonia phage GiKK]